MAPFLHKSIINFLFFKLNYHSAVILDCEREGSSDVLISFVQICKSTTSYLHIRCQRASHHHLQSSSWEIIIICNHYHGKSLSREIIIMVNHHHGKSSSLEIIRIENLHHDLDWLAAVPQLSPHHWNIRCWLSSLPDQNPHHHHHHQGQPHHHQL